MNNKKLLKTLVFSLICALFSIFLICLANVPNVKAAPSITLNRVGSTETTITFSWTESNDPLFSKYTLFNLHYNENENGPYDEVWSTTDKKATTTTIATTNIVYPNFKDSTTNYFYILETDKLGNSSKSNIITAKPTSSPNPNLYIASQTTTTATLQWTDLNIYCPQVPFNSYAIQVSNSSQDGPWSTIYKLTEKPEFTNQLTYTLTGLSTGTYYARMSDTVGTSGNTQTSYSKVVAITVSNTNTPQPSPTVPEFSLLAILPFLIVMLCILAILKQKRLFEKDTTNLRNC
jgi:hypothetical protein